MSTHSRNPADGPQTAQDEPGAGLLDALVTAERASMDPPPGGERQTWERVVASVAVGGPPPVQPSSISGPASTVTSLWIKVVLGVVIGGVVAAAAYRLSAEPEPAATTVARTDTAPSQRQPGPPSPPTTPTLPAPPATHAPPAPPAVAPRAQPPSSAPPAAVVPMQTPAEPSEASRAKPARAAPPEPDPPATSDLTEETRLLARARARLRAGSPSDALPPLKEHARRFPQGQLTEDRLVLQAQALCDSGETKAGLRKAAALRKAFPSSSHLPRVNRSCE